MTATLRRAIRRTTAGAAIAGLAAALVLIAPSPADAAPPCNTPLSASAFNGPWHGGNIGSTVVDLTWNLAATSANSGSAAVNEFHESSDGRFDFSGVGTFRVNNNGILQDLTISGVDQDGESTQVTYTVNSVTCTAGVPVQITTTSNWRSDTTYTLTRGVPS